MAASMTLPDSLASILTMDRCTNLSRCKSIGAVLVSTSNTSVAVALYASIATLRAFPYIDLILLISPLQAPFSPARVYYTAAPQLSADLATIEYICLPAANEGPQIEAIYICIALYRITYLASSNLRYSFYRSLESNYTPSTRISGFRILRSVPSFILASILYLFGILIKYISSCLSFANYNPYFLAYSSYFSYTLLSFLQFSSVNSLYISILISSTNPIVFVRSLILLYISKRSAL